MSFEIPITSVSSFKPETSRLPPNSGADEPTAVHSNKQLRDREVDIVRALGATFVLAAAVAGVLGGLGTLAGG